MPNHKQVKGKLIELSDSDLSEIIGPIPTDEQILEEKRKVMILTPWQFRQAINQLGHRDRVDELISNASRDTVDGWKVATRFKRLHPMVVQFGNAIPLTGIEMDELFELGATLDD